MPRTPPLHWLGQNARFVMAVGCFAALFLPSLSAFIRPALPLLVSMVLGLAMARLDLIDIAKDALKLKRLTRSIGLTILLMPVTACLYALLSIALPEADRNALILLAAAPPIASSTGICLLLGYNARLALETTLIATILTPIIGPALVAVFLPDMAPISPFDLAIRLGLIILGGIILGMSLRYILTPDRIDQNKQAFDGVAAIGMVIFVIPLFDGVGATILSNPSRALWVLLLSFVFNAGINALIQKTARTTPENAGALGVFWGNRTIALYLAALPHDPQFALFVALYQFPMYLTPLLFKPLKEDSNDT